MIKSVEDLYSYVTPRMKDGIEFFCSLEASKIRGNSRVKTYRLTFFIHNADEVLSYGRNVPEYDIDNVIDKYIEEVNNLSIQT